MCEILVKAVDVTSLDREKDACLYKRGYPVVVMDDGHRWGREECPPKFYIVKLPGVKKEDMAYLMEMETVGSIFEPGEYMVMRRKVKVEDARVPQDRLSDIESNGETTFASRAEFESCLVDVKRDGG